MNRSLQEYLRCTINGNDTKYTEWSTDVNLFPLAYISHITKNLALSRLWNSFWPKTTETNKVYSKFLKKYTRLLSTYQSISLLPFTTTYAWWRSFSSTTNLKTSHPNTHRIDFEQRNKQKKFTRKERKKSQRENVQSQINSRFYPRHLFKKRKISLQTKFFNRKKKKKKTPIRK